MRRGRSCSAPTSGKKPCYITSQPSRGSRIRPAPLIRHTNPELRLLENIVGRDLRVQAVIDGQGIALNDFLVDDEVEAGRLYQYRRVRLDSYGYFLVYPRRTAADAASVTFRDWIMRVAELDNGRLAGSSAVV